MYLVTLKLARNPDHDPQNKVTGRCPANPATECSDVTGEHHTVPVLTDEQLEELQNAGLHITRVEKLPF